TSRYSFFFFFQAEDGIRDLIVTGVQTCALPIFFAPGSVLLPVSAAVSGLSGGVTYNFRLVGANNNGTNYGAIQTFVMPFPPALRSEERRVGKECESRWARYR